jgi:hypothetical protein
MDDVKSETEEALAMADSILSFVIRFLPDDFQ